MKAPHIVAWEVTKACNLTCAHCRASASREPAPGELTTEEGLRLLEDLAESGTRMVILSGGEALARRDVMELAQDGTRLGLRMTLATNGSLVDRQAARLIKASGIARVSVSLDGAHASTHDTIRGMPGAFDMAVQGISRLVEAGVPVQVNTTVASVNISEMSRIPELVEKLGACAWHVFFLVPTGRGASIKPALVGEYRDMLEDFRKVSNGSSIECKATCAPQYYRMLLEEEGFSPTKGCLAGTGFGFVSATGEVQPCGFLQVSCGNVRQRPFSEIWVSSPLLLALRDPDMLKGKCGSCRFKEVCGGCRARAFEVLGDALETDPICWFP